MCVDLHLSNFFRTMQVVTDSLSLSKAAFLTSYNKIIHKGAEHLQILTGYRSCRMAGEGGVIITESLLCLR